MRSRTRPSRTLYAPNPAERDPSGQVLRVSGVHGLRGASVAGAGLAADCADGGQPRPELPDLLKDLGLLAVGLAAYGALFALAGAVLKRPLLIGLIYVLGWEPVIMVVPGYA